MQLAERCVFAARSVVANSVRSKATVATPATIKFKFAEAKGNSSSDSKNPLCILLGWAWASDKLLDKFVPLHTNAGRRTISYTLKEKHLFTFDLDSQRSAARQLASLASESGAESVLVHALSYNGFVIYQQLASILGEAEDSPRPRLAGAILDSVPGPWTVGQVFNVKSNYSADETPSRFSSLAGHFYLAQVANGQSLWKAARSTLSLVPEWRENVSRHYDPDITPGRYVMKQKMQHPLLFLYSQADTLMPAAFIKQVVSEQRKANPARTVRDKDFVKSPHVAHFKAFPEAYAEAVNDFVQNDVANFIHK